MGLLCVLCMVINFYVLLIFLGFNLSPKEHSIVFKYSLNVNMKLFLRGLAPTLSRLPDPQDPFDFCFEKYGIGKLTPGYVTA